MLRIRWKQSGAVSKYTCVWSGVNETSSPVTPGASVATGWPVEGSSDWRLPAVVTATSAGGRGGEARREGTSIEAVPVDGAWRVGMPVGVLMAPLGGGTAFAQAAVRRARPSVPSRARLAREESDTNFGSNAPISGHFDPKFDDSPRPASAEAGGEPAHVVLAAGRPP